MKIKASKISEIFRKWQWKEAFEQKYQNFISPSNSKLFSFYEKNLNVEKVLQKLFICLNGNWLLNWFVLLQANTPSWIVVTQVSCRIACSVLTKQHRPTNQLHTIIVRKASLSFSPPLMLKAESYLRRKAFKYWVCCYLE